MPRLLAELEDGRTVPVALRVIERSRSSYGVARERERICSLALHVQYRRCGKPNCSSCPHGPYAYVVFPDKRGGYRRQSVGQLAAGSPLIPRPPKAAARRPARRGRR